METKRSTELFERAQRVIPGGVNSPVRAFRHVGRTPLFMCAGEGAYVSDEDGNRFLDCVSSWGPLILGHRHPAVTSAVSGQLERAMTFGAPTRLEVEMAEELAAAVPSIQTSRLVSSGTEATMSAIRVARGATGRPLLVKFEGCYHGHADCLLSKAGSGVATLGLPDCAGVPAGAAADTITAPYNNHEAVRDLFRREGQRIAAVIVEPVAGNMGCVPPGEGFLELASELCRANGSLLIFDEVITGFRLAYGGAQELFAVTPDMTTLGKIAGGGLPLGVYGGRADVMQAVAPVGPVYQAGTLSGNPLAVSAGLATLRVLKAERQSVYGRLSSWGERVAVALRESARSHRVPVVVNQIGSMLTVFFTEAPAVTNYTTACTCDRQRFALWFGAMLEQGVSWPPSQFETAFLSAAMTEPDLDALITAADRAFAAL